MRQSTVALTCLFPCLVIGVSAGCAGHPLTVQQPRQMMMPQAAPTAMPPGAAHELQSRAASLDADNQQLQAQLAQQQQQSAQLQDSLQRAQKEVSALQQEVQRAEGPVARGQSGISASKTSYSGAALPIASIPGAEVLRDGDCVRIRIDSGQLFSPGKADLKPGVTPVLDHVAAALQSQYAGRMVGIEGHTDADPITKSKWSSNHELAISRSAAVFKALKQKGVPEAQLFISGYGPNRPVTDNKSAQGKALNRRVEIVVHPESALLSNGS